MTTNVVDSTVYPTSSIFFDSDDLSESNPLAVKRDGFNFNAKHNGVGCIESLSPEDRGTENQFWFTAQMFVDIFCELRRTIERNIESLLTDEEISMDKNVRTEKIPAMDGKSYQTTMYNLEVLNKLGMCCFRGNKKAKEIRNKFNDVLVKHETQTPMICLPQDYESALEALLTKVRENKALQAERDEAVRTKYLFVEGRDAKVCGELGGLRTQNEALRKQIGDSKRYKAVSAITWITDYFDISNRGVYGSLASKLKKVEEEMGTGYEHINIPDSKYGTVKAYHIDVIERLHAMIQSDESLMAKYRKILSV